MQNYSTPCYTLAETMEILGLRQSELHHAILNQNLRAVVYTKARPMLLFLRNKDMTWEGLAICTYRGHISTPPNVIATLLDEAKYKIGKGSVTLLDPTGISNWSIDYPYTRPLPHPPITDWKPIGQSLAIAQSRGIADLKQLWPIGQNRPIGQEDVPLYACAATPLPQEFEPASARAKAVREEYEAAIKAIAEGSFKAPNLNTVDINQLQLDFDSKSEIRQEDLRVPASEIARYKEHLFEQNKANKIAEVIEPIASATQRRRDSQLHDLIEKIIEKRSDISAKDAWGIIQKDSELDDRLFDTDHILEIVDGNCIEWTSRNGASQSMTWGSFQAKLSQIKKRTNKT